MKKSLLASALALLALCAAFAQDATATTEDEEAAKYADRTTVETIVPENQHITDKTATVEIKYMPMYDEARVYYRCMYVTYDKGEAMNTVMACLEDFAKEHQYKHYSYLARDKESYSKSSRGYNMAQYMSHVKFTR